MKSMAVWMYPCTASHTSAVLSRMPPKSVAQATAKSATAAMTMPIGPVKAAKTVPIPPMSGPRMTAAPPRPAKTAEAPITAAITVCTGPSRLVNHSTSLSMMGMSIGPACVARSSSGTRRAFNTGNSARPA